MPASGIRGIYDIPVGSHLCAFYRNSKEFLQVTAAFLSVGLTHHELCVWVLPPPVTIPLALEELSCYGVDPSDLIATKQLQLVSSADCFLPDGNFEVKRALRQVAAFSAVARQLGYATVRAAGGPGPFLSEVHRQAFMIYEHHATKILAELRMIGLCCYDSNESLAIGMFDIMSAHPTALLQTHCGWTCL